MLSTCDRCSGFVPAARASCPHCDAPIRRLARRLSALIGGGAAALTLMACYGGPPPPAQQPTGASPPLVPCYREGPSGDRLDAEWFDRDGDRWCDCGVPKEWEDYYAQDSFHQTTESREERESRCDPDPTSPREGSGGGEETTGGEYPGGY